MQETDKSIPTFLDKVVDFKGTSYELIQPLTNFRHCHDGVPAEARIVFTCKQIGHDPQSENVIKIKVQYAPFCHTT